MNEEWTKWVDWEDRLTLPATKNSIAQLKMPEGNIITVCLSDIWGEGVGVGMEDRPERCRIKLPDGLIMLRKIAADVKEDA